MNNLKFLIKDLNHLVLQGKLLQAFEKYYDEEVVMQENERQATIGKSENRKREEHFLNSLIDFREARVEAVTIGDNVTMVQWYYDYTHKDWGLKKYRQVSVQHWKNDKIIKEQFYYEN